MEKLKKIILPAVGGTIAYFAFGWFVFDFVLGSFTDHNTTHISGFKKSAEQVIYPALLLSCAAYAVLISYILCALLQVRSVLKGAAIAAIIGVLIAVMTDSYWYSSSNFYDNVYVVLADIIGAGISVGFLGAVVVRISRLNPK